MILEAGSNEDDNVDLLDSSQALSLFSTHYPEFWWQGRSTQQKNLSDRTFDWTSGRVFGGSSSVNGEQYVRGTVPIFEEWERAVGDSLWGPKEAFDNYKEFERYYGDSDDLGRFGDLAISQVPREPSSMGAKIVLAINGYDAPTVNYNDRETPMGGFTKWDLTQHQDGRRSSSSNSFLKELLVNVNGDSASSADQRLMVLFRSTATRILWDGNRAAGVFFLKDGVEAEAIASKKVILSAGIKTPKLLMLSGVGDGAELERLNIPVVHDSPAVGKNLFNHLMTTVEFTANESDTFDPLFTGGAFLPKQGEDRREYQLMGVASKGKLTIVCVHLQPKSTGEIKLQSKDPLDIELVNYKYLADPRDYASIKAFYRDYVPQLAANLTRIDPAYKLVSPSLETIGSDDQLRRFILSNIQQTEHYTGMSSMGPNGVVDASCHVRGVRDLLVADCGVMPLSNDGNTSSIAYLVGWSIGKTL